MGYLIQLPPLSSLVEVMGRAGAILAEAVNGMRFGHLDDAEAVAVFAALEGLGRRVDGARLRATSGWTIRLIKGRPHIRGPLVWDPTQTWRPTHTLRPAHAHRANTPSTKPRWGEPT